MWVHSSIVILLGGASTAASITTSIKGTRSVHLRHREEDTPLWFQRMQNDEITDNNDMRFLKKSSCSKSTQKDAPKDGTSCRRANKKKRGKKENTVCYFGTQPCDVVGDHPETVCTCLLDSNTWKCDPATCPSIQDAKPVLASSDCPAEKTETCSGNQICVFVTEGVTDFVEGGICTTTETATCIGGVFNTTDFTVGCVSANPPSIDNSCPSTKTDSCLVENEECVFVTEGVTDFVEEGICTTTETATCIGGVFNTTDFTVGCVSANPPSIDNSCPITKTDSCLVENEECVFVTEGVTDFVEEGICTTTETATCIGGVFNTTDFTVGCVSANPPSIDNSCPMTKTDSCLVENEECVFVTEGVTDFVEGGICTTTETATCIGGVFNTTEFIVGCVDDNPPTIDSSTTISPP